MNAHFPPPGGQPELPIDNFEPRPPLHRKPAQRKLPLVEKSVRGLAVVAGGAGILALNNLITETGPAANIKTLLLGIAMACAPYVVNTIAIRDGARFAAAGYRSALLASVFGITLIGSTVALSTLSGLVLKDVAELQLQERTEQHSQAVAVRAEMMRKSQMVIGTVQSIARDLNSKSACEKAASCLSLKPKGGRGEVARTVEVFASRATDVSEQASAKKGEGEKALGAANALMKEFGEASSEAGKDIWSRRASAELIDARLRQTLSTIDEATPTSIVAGFRTELEQGIQIDGDPETTRRINAILKTHSESLAHLGVEDTKTGELAAFPKRPGVLECVEYLPHFWTIGSLVFSVEVALPLLLLWFAYLTALSRYDEIDPPDGGGLSVALSSGAARASIGVDVGTFPEGPQIDTHKRIGHMS